MIDGLNNVYFPKQRRLISLYNKDDVFAVKWGLNF